MSDDICPDCRAEDPEYDGPGIPVGMPGTRHKADCPRVAWIGDTSRRLGDEHARTNHGLLRSPGEIDADRVRQEAADLRRRVERLERAAADRGQAGEER